MADASKQLYDVVGKIIDDRKTEERIIPTWIATEAMKIIDPMRTAEPLVYLGCHLQLRQIARGLCRGKFESDEDESTQHNLFPDLQYRYPSARASSQEEPQYVLLECMTKIDRSYNVERLRREGRTKLQHADALEAYDQRFPSVA